MDELTYKIIFGLLWILFILIRVPHDKRYQKAEKKKISGGGLERFLVLLLSLGLFFMPLLWIFSPWLNSYAMHLADGFRLLGALLAALSLGLFWWVHKTLGENWSPVLEIRKGHQLIKNGPYRSIRHPMYTQIWIWTLAQALLLSNWVAGLVGIFCWAILYFIRVPREEKMMLEEFGDAYRTYMQQTGRILPRWW